jgi:hypothetical protein
MSSTILQSNKAPRRLWLATIALFGLTIPSLALAQGATAPGRDAIDFDRQIKPLLAKRCYHCHGPDQAEGGLQFNDREVVFSEVDSGNIPVVPGSPEDSELLRRISSDSEFERMPPPDEKPLSGEEIALVRRWIEQGAVWKGHWAFEDLSRPEVPQVKQAQWVANPIDAFVLAQLEANGLQPTPAADKVALLRRVYYDLTGLPPTPAEVDAFLADTSPEAYERVVDRLLDSPHYGERWARHWLDVVRFAETNSFERDNPKPHAWRFRDYVIRSFNADKPYDQFIIEQLAGDEMPDPTNDSLIATGYYRLGLWDDEPADRLLARFDEFDDLVSTTSQAFLGLTLNCARCHDHKIDPIPQTDYYGMVAFFQNIQPMSNGGPNIERPLFQDQQAEAEYRQRTAELEQHRNEVQQQITQIETAFRAAYSQREKQNSLAANDLDQLTFRFYRDSWTALPDFDNLKAETTGKVPGGLFDIGLRTRDSAIGFVFEGILVVPTDGEYTFYLDSDDGSRLTIDGQQVIEYDGVHGMGSEQQATVKLAAGRHPIRLDYFQSGNGLGLQVAWQGPGFERRSLTPESGEAEVPGRIEQAIARQGRKLLSQEQVAAYRDLRKQLAELNREQVPVEKALCVTERGTTVDDTFVMQRGNPRLPGDKVEPTFPTLVDTAKPEIAPPPSGIESSGRRYVLAKWIASPENKMTSRVMVNRIWQHHFGRGIVRSPNNFGQLGVPPTHPRLLDWLATRFVELDWQMKPLHKLIVMSNTYRMDSRPSDLALEKDPANDLFSRFDMRRLSAEEVRDSVHAVNGRLNDKMYGPGFYPTISQEVLAGQSVPGKGWGNSSPEQQARRSIYIHVKRSLITPLLEDFDFPDTDTSCEARFMTTQPAQALGLLNGDFLNGEAKAFAERIRQEAGTDPDAQIRRAIRLVAGRPVTDDDLRIGRELMQTLKDKYQLSDEQALQQYCVFALNLNEFIYLD